MVDQAQLKQYLQIGEVHVTFTKTDGTERRMCCTLHPKYAQIAPKTSTDSGSTPRAKNEDVQPVWDIDCEGWRSFRWDSVTRYQLLTVFE
jgi:hypothetical protein